MDALRVSRHGRSVITVHAAADLFVATLAARQMALSEVEAADVHAISARLAERRAPAFHSSTTKSRQAGVDADRATLI